MAKKLPATARKKHLTKAKSEFAQPQRRGARIRTPRSIQNLKFLPATPDRWPDVEKLFGERGACGGCWCMTWRIPRPEFNKGKGEANRKSFRAIIRNGEEPGVIAYSGREPVGWCAVAPRSVYVTLNNSRVLKPIDDKPVWSISCLFVRRDFRRCGVSSKLADAAARYAFKHGAKIVEAYPIEPYTDNMPAAFAWTGIPSAFTSAGFTEVARRSKSRPILRRAYAKS
ncbi:MAG TPA: GNAT family N-acetyltransferase [Phycisphaerales bacterium]|nr:GNAT family N-acetyltransferase [Phycisphaerales bacterium]